LVVDDDRRAPLLELGRVGRERVPPRPGGDARDHVLGAHGAAVGVEEREDDPAGGEGVHGGGALPRLVELCEGEGDVRARERRRRGSDDLGARDLGRAKTEAKHPEVRVLVVGIEAVGVTLAIDGGARRTAAPERREGLVGRCDPSGVEARGDIGERHRAAVLDQRDEQERVGVGLGVMLHLLQAGIGDVEELAIGSRHGDAINQRATSRKLGSAGRGQGCSRVRSAIRGRPARRSKITASRTGLSL
jgi:hypothetical protein